MSIDNNCENNSGFMDNLDTSLMRFNNKLVSIDEKNKENIITKLYVCGSALISSAGIMAHFAQIAFAGAGLGLWKYQCHKDKIERQKIDKVIDFVFYAGGGLGATTGLGYMITGTITGNSADYKGGCMLFSIGAGMLSLSTASYLSADSKQINS